VHTKEGIEVTCPDCRGPLSLQRTDTLVEVRCLVGHTYSPQGVLTAHSEAQEKALWSALVALKETSPLLDAIADQLPPERVERLRAQVAKKQAQAAVLQKLLEELEPFQP